MLGIGALAPAAAAESVVTYHYDNNRTGWNPNETILNTANVTPTKFGVLKAVALDDQVDAQPLVVPGLTTVGGAATNGDDVVYVATENNSVYAIDATTGLILAQRNLGAPVPAPSNCDNNGPNVGIMGTPVIVPGAPPTMYLVMYGVESGADVYRIHALSVTTLDDVAPSVVVTASHELSNGGTVSFTAASQRQRPALLAANGNIYAGFGSHCDFNGATSRGWILGWQQGTLTPLAANELTNTLSTSPNDFFLAAVWMSGYGLAADSSGYVYAVTGNSDKSGTTYSPTNNLSESVIKLSPDLSKLADYFTPYFGPSWDTIDYDFGAGGVLVVPPQPGATPNLLAAAGKTGTMYVLNGQALGEFTPNGPNNDLVEQVIGKCWCGQAYFGQTSGGNVIVAAGGPFITLWTIQTSPSVALINAGVSPQLDNGQQNPGHFPTISSNGAGPGVVIWAVSRPVSATSPAVYLYAFSQTLNSSGELTTLLQTEAGSWPAIEGNANITPVVANGRVYVASYKQLRIFGLLN